MITTVQSLAIQLARYLGITSFSTSDNTDNRINRPVTTADKNALVLAINGAYEEIFKDGPSTISETNVGAVLRPPSAITLTATQYSTTIGSVVTYASWMQGCTIRIAGDTNDNELVNGTTLHRPFVGATGSTTATVYADCLPLSGVLNIMPPISILNHGTMRLEDSREGFTRACWIDGGYGSDEGGNRTAGNYNATTDKQSGDPTAAFLDSRYAGGTAGLTKFMRFNRLPAAALSVTYRAKLTPPSFTISDIGSDIATDPGTTLPLDGLSSIIYAIALKRLTADPLFGSPDAIPEIHRQYVHATGQLGASQVSLAPKKGHYH
jgi:hypothetical protein